MKVINISEVIGKSNAVSSSDGEKIFEIISAEFNNNESIELDFSGIQLTITAFLNSSIGNLYANFSVEKIKENLTISNLQIDDLELLQFVIEKAKQRFGGIDTNEIDLIDEK